MVEHHRSDDYTIGKLVAEMQAHRDDFARERLISQEWRARMEDRTKINEDFIAKVDTPLKVLLWCVAAISAAVFGAVGLGLWNWFGRHWNQ